MPRNSSGTYSLPGSNPVVTGTTISSTWANGTMSDLGTETTNSLDRNGRGAMNAPLQLSTGAAGAPSITWSADSTSGLYRAGAGDYRFSVLSLDALKIGTGVAATGATPQVALTLPNGYLSLDGAANPNSSVGFKNRLTPKNVSKCWASITTNGSGSVFINDGFNIASVSLSGAQVVITFATAMADTNYVAVAADRGAGGYFFSPGSIATGSFRVLAENNGGTINMAATALSFGFVVFGSQ